MQYFIQPGISWEDMGDRLVFFDENNLVAFSTNKLGRLVFLSIKANLALTELIAKVSTIMGVDQSLVEADFGVFLDQAKDFGILESS